MNAATAVANCLRKYAIIDGRAGRAEFWHWIRFCVFVVGGATFLKSIVVSGSLPHDMTAELIVTVWYFLLWALLLPTLAVAIRRLHVSGDMENCPLSDTEN